MERKRFAAFVVVLLSLIVLPAAAASQGGGDATLLATVRIPVPVSANGMPLVPGTYDLRLTQERPTPPPGQSWEASRWVEFVANGKVVAREAAEILRDDDLPSVGASSAPVRDGTRVEMLKDGEFLRVSVKRKGERYLLYLPVKR